MSVCAFFLLGTQQLVRDRQGNLIVMYDFDFVTRGDAMGCDRHGDGITVSRRVLIDKGCLEREKLVCSQTPDTHGLTRVHHVLRT